MKKLLIIFIVLFFPLSVWANIVCNDGTISPSCSDCHKGCCSHHGGCKSGSTKKKSTTKKSTTKKATPKPTPKVTATPKPTSTPKPTPSPTPTSTPTPSPEPTPTATPEIIYGCMDSNALNYNINATQEDGSCIYEVVDEEIDNNGIIDNNQETTNEIIDDNINNNEENDNKDIFYFIKEDSIMLKILRIVFPWLKSI